MSKNGLFKSPQVRKYLQKLGVKKYSVSRKEYENYKKRENVFAKQNFELVGEPPYYIEFTFIRDSKRNFDLINACQILQDLMVAHRWIEDDNYNYLIPVFNNKTTVDKNNAGVFIRQLCNKRETRFL